MNWLKVPGVSTKGDIATVLISGTSGFVIDLTLFPLGVPPGTTAGLFASSALGIKKAIEANIEMKAEKSRNLEEAENLVYRVDKLIGMLENSKISETAESLKKAKTLYELNILTAEELEEELIKIAKRYTSGKW